METLFENKYKRTADIYKEYFRYAHFFSPMRIVIFIIMMCMSLLITATVLVAAASETLDNDLITTFVMFCVLLAFYILLCILPYFSSVRIAQKRERELNGDEPLEISSYVSEEDIIFKTRLDGEARLSYSSIKSITVTKNLIVLTSKAKQAFIFPKAAFTKGIPEVFVEFIRIKMKGKPIPQEKQ